ncbi:hypothetical protein RUND412_010959 [Rhizina undulata]
MDTVAMVVTPEDFENDTLAWMALLTEDADDAKDNAFDSSVTSALSYLGAEESFLESLTCTVNEDCESATGSKERCGVDLATTGQGFLTPDSELLLAATGEL